MFRKQDFKKVDVYCSRKKNIKIFKALYLPTGKYFALKEIEAKSMEKFEKYKEEFDILNQAKSYQNIVQTFGHYFYETHF